MFKGTKNLYLIKGKLVFRAHIRKNGQNKHVWKTLGDPDEFSEDELRLIVKQLLNEVWGKEDSKDSRGVSVVMADKKVSSSVMMKCVSPSLGEAVERFLLWYKQTRRVSSYERYRKASKVILDFF